MGKTVKEVFDDGNIEILDLAKLIIARYKLIVVSVLIFLTFGLIGALTTPKEYVASSITLSEAGGSNETGITSIGNLAGLAGINIPQQAPPNFSPSMYPQLLGSRPFLLKIMGEEYYFTNKGEKMSLYEYYITERPQNALTKMKGFILGLPRRFFSLFKSKSTSPDTIVSQSEVVNTKGEFDILNVTPQQQYVIYQLDERLQIEIKDRMITLAVQMPEPLIAAQVNNKVLENIIEYVIDYKTNKIQQDLEFIEELTSDAEENFRKAQNNLANFRDKNQGIVSEIAKTEEEHLKLEFDVAFNIYNRLKQELEQTKIQLKRETPVFTPFEEVIVPFDNEIPNISRTVIFSILGGIFFGLVGTVIVLVVEYYRVTT